MVCGGMVPQGRQAGGWAIRELWVGASSFVPPARRRILKLAACSLQGGRLENLRSARKRLCAFRVVSHLVQTCSKIRPIASWIPSRGKESVRTGFPGCQERTMRAEARHRLENQIRNRGARTRLTRECSPDGTTRTDVLLRTYGADEEGPEVVTTRGNVDGAMDRHVNASRNEIAIDHRGCPALRGVGWLAPRCAYNTPYMARTPRGRVQIRVTSYRPSWPRVES